MNTADNCSIFIPYNIRDSDALLPSLIRAAKKFYRKMPVTADVFNLTISCIITQSLPRDP